MLRDQSRAAERGLTCTNAEIRLDCAQLQNRIRYLGRILATDSSILVPEKITAVSKQLEACLDHLEALNEKVVRFESAQMPRNPFCEP